MAFCGNCGRQIPTGETCRICGGDAYNKSGTLVAEDPSSDTVSTWTDNKVKENIVQSQEQYYKGGTVIGQYDAECDKTLVVSLILALCCSPWGGLLSLFFLIKAKASNAQEAQRNLKIAKTINLVTLILILLVLLVLLAVTFLFPGFLVMLSALLGRTASTP